MADWRKQIDVRGMLQARAGSVRPPRLRTSAKAAREEQKGREVVGLEIGASHLTAARVVNNGSKEILQLVREPLAPGLIAGGEVRDPLGLGSALEAFFTKHGLPRRGV